MIELPNVAQQIIANASDKKIWFFIGEMGVGKTTLIKEICKILRVQTEMSSPTFSIVNEYKTITNKKIFHFDLFRVKNLDELNQIGFTEYLDSGNLCFIEWPEILPPLENSFKIKLEFLEDKRTLVIE